MSLAVPLIIEGYEPIVRRMEMYEDGAQAKDYAVCGPFPEGYVIASGRFDSFATGAGNFAFGLTVSGASQAGLAAYQSGMDLFTGFDLAFQGKRSMWVRMTSSGREVELYHRVQAGSVYVHGSLWIMTAQYRHLWWTILAVPAIKLADVARAMGLSSSKGKPGGDS